MGGKELTLLVLEGFSCVPLEPLLFKNGSAENASLSSTLSYSDNVTLIDGHDRHENKERSEQ